MNVSSGRRRARLSLVLGLLAIACLPRAVSTQAPPSLELSAGYSYLRDPRLDLNFPIGWAVGAAGRVNAWLSAVADVSGSRTTFPTIAGDLGFGLRAFMFGARASAKVGPFVEFGQILVGVVHASGTAFGTTSSTTHAGAQIGAGLDCPLKGRLSVRGEIDFRVIGAEQGAGLGREVRGLAGVVYRIF
jgi:hypothetical protein